MFIPNNFRIFHHGGSSSCFGSNCSSAFNSWGKWVLLGVLVAVAVIVIILGLLYYLGKRRLRRILELQDQEAGPNYSNQGPLITEEWKSNPGQGFQPPSYPPPNAAFVSREDFQPPAGPPPQKVQLA